MYESILLPTDGSENAETAIGHAITNADRFDATLHVLSVLESERTPDSLLTPRDVGSIHRELRARAERAVEAVATQAREHGIEVVTEIEEGRPAVTIREYVVEHAIDLVVMGTQGRTGFSRYALGSVAEAVLRRVNCSILTVHQGTTEPVEYESLLIATDGSPASEPAIRDGVKLAHEYQARVEGIYVIDVRHSRSAVYLDALAQMGGKALRRVETESETVDVPVESNLTRGVPRQEITRYAEEEGFDLLVIGTRRRRGLDRIVRRSVAERIVRRSSVPVLTVPA